MADQLIGLHQMPGDVWWRTWRTLPPQQCATDPDFSWQGQEPAGYWQNNEVIPETRWGQRGFGLADVRTAQVQIKYATEQLHYPRPGAVTVQHRR